MLPLLMMLLAASGCAALIYEIVWLQLLQLAIGSSAVSVGLLLAAYMGGLCLGSAALPRVVSPKQHPLGVYAFLEVGIGIFGIVALFLIPALSRVYIAGAMKGSFEFVLRGLTATICLLPPTLLMGATLPAIARWWKSTPQGVSRLGFLYSGNIAGAVFGCVFAGFYLLRVHDVAVATYVAAAINLAVALISVALALRTKHAPATDESIRERVRRPIGAKLIYIVTALSGMCALGAEVIWTRLLSLLLGGTVYTFSIILGVFLLGLWLGSSVGSLVAGRARHVRLALAGSQLLLAMGIAWTGYTLSHSLPYWPVDPWLSINPRFNFELDLVRCLWAIFPATLLWGASFPLALAAVAALEQDPGQVSGEIYAANTAASIAGALLFSLVFLRSISKRDGMEQYRQSGWLRPGVAGQGGSRVY